MSDTNTPVDTQDAFTNDDDLDAFSNDFFGQKPATEAPQEAKPEDENDDANEVEGDANNEAQNGNDTPDPEDESETPEDDDDSDNEPEPEPKPKKGSFQERINELTRDKRELERRLQALEAKAAPKDEPKPEPQPEVKSEGPDPLALNEDGTEKYPLGEFDPKYLRDVMRHEHQTLMEEQSRKAKETAEQARIQQEQLELQSSWKQKVESAQERYPDLQQKVETALDPAFEGVDPSYGEYLATLVMQMDKGPDVLYHLAENPDEARRIIAMGPTKAAVALGKLEARFDDDGEPQPVKKKTTDAPPPPPANRGTNAAKAKVSPTTDDLEAFERLFFENKRR